MGEYERARALASQAVLEALVSLRHGDFARSASRGACGQRPTTMTTSGARSGAYAHTLLRFTTGRSCGHSAAGRHGDVEEADRLQPPHQGTPQRKVSADSLAATKPPLPRGTRRPWSPGRRFDRADLDAEVGDQRRPQLAGHRQVVGERPQRPLDHYRAAARRGVDRGQAAQGRDRRRVICPVAQRLGHPIASEPATRCDHRPASRHPSIDARPITTRPHVRARTAARSGRGSDRTASGWSPRAARARR